MKGFVLVALCAALAMPALAAVEITMPQDPTATAKVPKLSARDKRFVDATVRGLLPIEAAVDAGVKPDLAEAAAKTMLAKPEVRASIRVAKLAEVDSTAILLELAAIAFTDVADFYDANGAPKPFSELTAEQRKALAGVELESYGGENKLLSDGEVMTRPHVQISKLKVWDKLRALELLGKWHGGFADKVDVKHSGKVTLEDLVPKRKPA
jgi:phage terminase small subunit